MIAEGDWGTEEKTTQTQFQKTTTLAQLAHKMVPFVSKLLLIQGTCNQKRQSLTLLKKINGTCHWTCPMISVLEHDKVADSDTSRVMKIIFCYV